MTALPLRADARDSDTTGAGPTVPAANPGPDRYPAGIKYIIGNEACERFSFYGMRSILTLQMVALYAALLHLEPKLAKALATQHYHVFTAAVYALPMVGAILSDRLLGKYRTILGLSLVYCAGHAVLAFAEGTLWGLYFGLALIAVGSGGIKPCVSAHVGDQFSASNSHLVKKIFAIFYFTINFGSFFSYLVIPWTYRAYGPSVAFGIPGVLMFMATFVFWLGRNKFVHVRPAPGGRLGAYDALSSVLLFMSVGSLWFTGSLPVWSRIGIGLLSFSLGIALFSFRARLQPDTGFLSILLHAVRNRKLRKPGGDLFTAAEPHFGEELADGPRAVLRILSIFALVSVFWALFDQKGSTWVVQASEMDGRAVLPFLGQVTIQAPQMGSLNPAMVMIFIPLLARWGYPLLARMGVGSPLRRMTLGMFIAALAYVAVALVQREMDALVAPYLGLVPMWLIGMADLQVLKLSIFWQIVPYFLITLGEVMVSVTGLEFAYTQAPRAMKATVMGFWSLSVTVGSLLVAFLAGFQDLPREMFFWTFAGLMALAGVVFGFRASFYKVRNYLQT